MANGLNWRTPLVILLAGTVVLILAFGIRTSFGIFMVPISSDMGWGREVFGFSMAMQNLLWGAAQPFAGAIADRWGSGRVIAGCGALYVLGLLVMAGAIAILFVVPWLDKSPVKSLRYKGLASKIFLALFVISFFILGYLGTVHPTPGRTIVAQVCTAIYFGYFLLMPWYTKVEKTKPVPERVPG